MTTATNPIPTPGIGFLLASATRADTPLQLRPEMLEEGGVDRFWDEAEAMAREGLISSLFIHRPYGETPGGFQRFDSVHNIISSGDPALTDYYQRFRRRLNRFAIEWPQVRLDIYNGSLRCDTMQTLAFVGDAREYQRRVHIQTEHAVSLITQGHNVRLIFDHSATYEDGSIEAATIGMLRSRFGAAVVVEALPRPDIRWTRGLDAWAFESVYRQQTTNHADEYAEDPGILGPITRCWDRHANGTIPEFLADCAAKGHTAQVPDVHIARSGMSIAEIRDLAQAIADRPQPQGDAR